MMIKLISKYWWVFVLRGSAAVIFGLVAFFSSSVTLRAVVIVFGLYVLLEGVLLIGSAIGGSADEQWWVPLTQGFVSMMAWIFTFTWPGITAIAVLSLIAAWALITGILEIVSAVLLRKETNGEPELVLSGMVSVLFALILLENRIAGTPAVVWTIGIYAIIFGALMIALGFKIQKAMHV